MSELLQEIHEEVQEIVTLKENIEPFLAECPTLVEDAEMLLGKVTSALQGGKSLAGNENMAKALAGLKVLMDPDIRSAVAPEIKGINPKFTIKDVIMKAGEDQEANKVLMRVADMYAKSEVDKYGNILKTIDEDPAKKEALIKNLNKMRMQYSRVKGLLTKGPQTQKPMQ